jgi:hypothetical protein
VKYPVPISRSIITIEIPLNTPAARARVLVVGGSAQQPAIGFPSIPDDGWGASETSLILRLPLLSELLSEICISNCRAGQQLDGLGDGRGGACHVTATLGQPLGTRHRDSGRSSAGFSARGVPRGRRSLPRRALSRPVKCQLSDDVASSRGGGLCGTEHVQYCTVT